MSIAHIAYDVRKKRWELLRDYWFSDGLAFDRVPKGFEYDLATIPRILWSLIAPHELSTAAPLVHDWIYHNKGTIRHGGEGLVTYSRKEADRLFLRMMIDAGVPRCRARVAYFAVRATGWLYWNDLIR